MLELVYGPHLMEYGVRLSLPYTLGYDYNHTITDDGRHSAWEVGQTAYLGLSPSGNVIPMRDIFMSEFFRHSLVRMYPVDGLAACGLSGYQSVTKVNLGCKPRTRPFRAELDSRPYSLFQSYHGLWGRCISNRYETDNNVTHYNGEGYITPILDSIQYDTKDVQVLGIPVTVINTIQSVHPTNAMPRHYDTSTDVLFDWDQHLFADAHALVLQMQSSIGAFQHTHFPQTWEIETVRLLSVHDSKTSGLYTITYEYETERSHVQPNATSFDYSKWRVSIAVSARVGAVDAPPPGSVYDLRGVRPLLHVTYEHLGGGYESTYFGVQRSTPHPYYKGRFNTVVPLVGFLSSPKPGTNVPSNTTFSKLRTVVNDNGRYWNSLYRELQYSAQHSFVKAVSSPFKLLKNPILEALFELSDLPELLPDGIQFLQAVGELRRGKASSLLKLGDVVASNYLKYHFGIKPTAELIGELNLKTDKVLDLISLSHRMESVTLRASHTYRFKTNETRVRGVLTTTSNVIASYPVSPWHLLIYKLYGINLATLKGPWEVVPFSFAIDWFTNMSARFEHIDMAALSYTASVDFVSNSYRVASPFPHVDGYDVSNASLVYYRREVTKIIPHLITGGKFDFLDNATGPTFGILASLVYSLLRSKGS